MTYEEFKIAVTAEVVNQLGEEVNVTTQTIQKNNGVSIDTISIMEKGYNMCPSIYLEDMYQHYVEEDWSLKKVAEWAIRIHEAGKKMCVLPDDFYMTYEKVRKRVCFRLVNYEKNRQLLNEVPHDKVLDLAVVYYYSVEPEYLEHATMLIRNVDLQRWKIHIDELRDDAKRNTPYLNDWELITIWDLVESMLLERGVKLPERLKEDESITMYILTNEERYFGASCILYPHVLESIADRLNSPFYILPSSIHECIIKPVSEHYTQESLSEMVREINESHVDEKEVLSDRAYYYDPKEKEVIW